MNIFTFKRYSEEEEKLYEQVGIELENQEIDKGLWTKALSNSNGDDSKTESLYIKYRVEKLLSLIRASEEPELREQRKKENKKIYKFLVYFIITVFVVFIFQYIFSISKSATSSLNEELVKNCNNITTPIVTRSTLIEESNSNPIRFKNDYIGECIRVEDSVLSISEDGVYFGHSFGGWTATVVCENFKEEDLLTLNIGEYVKFSGELEYLLSGGTLAMKNCSL